MIVNIKVHSKLSANGDKLENKPKILIIDGNGLAYRCLHSHGDLGFFDDKESFQHTGMPYGFITNLLYMQSELNPDYIAVVWDGGSKYRRDLYPQYKRKRREKRIEQLKIDAKIINEQKIKKEKNFKPPHDILKEMSMTINILSNLGIQQFRSKDEEADDIIGSITKKLHENYNITIASNDHDFSQLLRFSNVSIFKSYIMRGKTFKDLVTKDKFIKKYGFNPRYYPNLLALTGDKTDEYPGVKGIGEKIGISLIKDFGPELETVIKNCENDKIPPRWSNLILKNKSIMFMCKRLARIRCGLEINKIKSERDINLVKDIFKNLRFHSLLFDDKFNSIIQIPHEEIKNL